MVKLARTPEPQTSHHRTQDICGLVLFFLGAAALLSLGWRQQAVLPDLVADFLRAIAGVGAFVIPLLLMFGGTMFLLGYQRFSVSSSSLGTLLLFLVFLTARHLTVVGKPRPSTAELSGAGGWLGWMFGEASHALLGTSISYLLLILLAAVGVVLIANQPFVLLLSRWWKQSLGGVAVVGQATQTAKRAVTSRQAETPALVGAGTGSRRAPKALPTPEADNPERTLRAAEVVERALSKNAKPSLQPELPLPDADDEDAEAEPSTSSKLFRMFGLTAPWRTDKHIEEDDEPDVPASVVPEPIVAEAEKPAADKVAKPARKEKIAKPEEVMEDAELLTAPEILLPPFQLPPLTLLKESPPAVAKRTQQELTNNVKVIEQTLEQFNIGANVVEVAGGPSVTRYEVQLAPGIKVSKIVSLADNLAMSLAAIDVRVEAPIPGKSAIGVEVPNGTPTVVSLRECLDTDEFRNAPSKLTVALGKDVSGNYKYADLTKMPHLLIGGSTNSGKSICLNVLIASLVYRNTPRDVKLLMIDPKRVELSLWEGIPHLMHPVVKDVKQASGIFRIALKEMDRRYDLFATMGTRNIDGYNQRVPESERLPYVVLIVDELADLMIQQGPEVETSICRLAQLARATGIHLVIATQRPSVDIITGTIKANISSRIAFAVASQIDSRTILDMAGADRLIGRGDMLFMPIDAAKPTRIQGCWISEQDTNSLVQYLKDQESPHYTVKLSEADIVSNASRGTSAGGADEEVDHAIFEQAVRLVVNNGQASTSMLQRRFRIGYTRAARVVEMMEERGIVGALNGAKPREILVTKDEVEQMFNLGGNIPSVDDYEDEEEE